MEIIKILLLSLVEGFTEFIPVSSTGHMLILNEYIGYDEVSADTFIIFIQLGAILAAVFVYWEKFVLLIPRPGRFKEIVYSESFPSYTHIILACLPVMVGGLLFYKQIKTVLFNPQSVSVALVAGGIAMILAERYAKGRVEKVEQITPMQALGVGLFQCFALIPGMSRSGSTIIGSLILGIKLRPAVDFSFIIAVPVMTAAVSYELYKSMGMLSTADIPAFLLGFGASFFFALVSIRWFLKILARVPLAAFGGYRILLGLAVLLLSS